jgi:acyl-CoA thioesterase I
MNMQFKPLISISISGAVFLIMLAFSLSAFAQSAQAADYYVDCSAPSNGNGTFASPFNSISAVNAAPKQVGTDIYFKVGTQCNITSNTNHLQIRHSGTESDRVIIGAYHGNGLFGLGGQSRPIITGSNNQYPTGYNGAIFVNNGTSTIRYVTVRDIRLNNTGVAVSDRLATPAQRPVAIRVFRAENVDVINCYTYRTGFVGIEYGRVVGGTISDNTVEQPGYPSFGMRTGAAITVTAANNVASTRNILVARNKVLDGVYEGIGAYQGTENVTIEHNIVRNTSSFMIYLDKARYATIRYNLVYFGSNSPITNRSRGICIDDEHHTLTYGYSKFNKIYGNFVANTATGIALMCNVTINNINDNCHEGLKVYNNTLVDNTVNMLFSRMQPADTALFKNNVSLLATSGLAHMQVAHSGTLWNPPGTTFSHNLFYGYTLPTSGSKAAVNMITGHPQLTKQSGWRSLVVGDLQIESLEAFKLRSTSAAIDKGTALVSPYNVDYFKTPRPQGPGWDIGAHELGSAASIPQKTVNILPLGDSITENAPTKSYRYYLWSLLKNNGYDVNFIGSKQTQKYENFDPDHEGRSGWRADEIAAALPAWLKTYTPDIVLLHIGHNDFFQGESVENVVADINNIINILQSNNPKVTILLAKIIPSKNPTLKRDQLNALIPGIADSKTTAASKIYVVDQTDGYEPQTDNADGTHPNELGNEKIAKKWFETLKVVLSKSGDNTFPAACNKLSSNSSFPPDFGSPYNMAINRQELLINTNCQSSSVQLNIGNNSPNQYIWSKAYVWRNNAWQIINLNGSTPAYNNLWFKGSANASVNLTSQEISQENKIVAFVCNWHNNSWKCGCRDSACGQMFWQLQVFGNY